MLRDNQDVTDIVMPGYIISFLVKTLIILMHGTVEALQALHLAVILIIYMIVHYVQESIKFTLKILKDATVL